MLGCHGDGCVWTARAQLHFSSIPENKKKNRNCGIILLLNFMCCNYYIMGYTMVRCGTICIIALQAICYLCQSINCVAALDLNKYLLPYQNDCHCVLIISKSEQVDLAPLG